MGSIECFTVLNNINAVLGPFGFLISSAGFVISIISLVKIGSVEENIKKQKNITIFKNNYEDLCNEIDRQTSILHNDGINQNLSAIKALCDKIKRYSEGLDKKDYNELITRLSDINTLCEATNVNISAIETQLMCVKNLISKAGELNGI